MMPYGKYFHFKSYAQAWGPCTKGLRKYRVKEKYLISSCIIFASITFTMLSPYKKTTVFVRVHKYY